MGFKVGSEEHSVMTLRLLPVCIYCQECYLEASDRCFSLY